MIIETGGGSPDGPQEGRYCWYGIILDLGSRVDVDKIQDTRCKIYRNKTRVDLEMIVSTNY